MNPNKPNFISLFIRKNRTRSLLPRIGIIAIMMLVALGGDGLFPGLVESTAYGQTTVNAGGFRVQFWSQGDNGGSGANVLNGTIADTDLGTWSAAEQQAVIRAFEYWSAKLNLAAATANSPTIRVVKDESSLTPNGNARSVPWEIGGVDRTPMPGL